MFENIVGNDHIKRYLERMVVNKTIGNSLLFAGPEGIGKSLFAEEIAKQLLGKETIAHHPDYHIYRPEGKTGMHSIQSMREFSEEVYMAPFEGKWKVFVIRDADRMLTYSANALLKTFEEPAPHSLIILLSSSPESLLPTILSRCRVVRFQAVARRKEGEARDPIREKVLDILAKGKATQYYQLTGAAREISDLVEESKKQEEEQLREAWKKEFQEMSAVQREAVEKDVEGAVAMRLSHHAQIIFEVILGWYRDMQLFQINGNRDYLIHQDRKMENEQALQRGLFQPLESVQKAVADAQLSLDRSTALNIVLERLLLQLGLA